MLRETPPIYTLRFGLADAGREADRYPNLLLDGFYDPNGLAGDLLHGDPWLILGAKGTGKSAVVEHLRLLHESEAAVSVRLHDLYEFPYKDFVQIDSVDGDSGNLPAAWRWVLLLALFDSFNRDTANWSSRWDDRFQRAARTLEDAGFLGGKELRQIVQESNTRTIGTALKGITGTYGRARQNRGLAISGASQTLAELVCTFRSPARHLLVLDGLDKQFVSGGVPWEAIGALVTAVDKLNADLIRGGAAAKVVVLARPDMFDRLMSAETAKIKRDSGRVLDWYPSSARHESSPLFTLFNQKASASSSAKVDVVADYLPPSIRPRGSRSGTQIPIHRYLLERTRHTPRDLGQLLESIKDKARIAGEAGRVSVNTVIDGANEYAFDYFYADVRSTLVGLVPMVDVDKVLALLKVMPGDKFSRRALLDAAKQRTVELTADRLDEVLNQLYQAGAIANIDRHDRVNFLFAQSTGELDKHGLMTLQRTFARGLNRAPLWHRTEA